MSDHDTKLHPYGPTMKSAIAPLARVPRLGCLHIGCISYFCTLIGFLCGDVRVFWQLSGWYCGLSNKGRSRYMIEEPEPTDEMMWEWAAQEQRRQWRKALWMLLTTNNGDYEWLFWRSWGLKALCIFAMLLGRDGLKGYCNTSMGWWDHQDTYGGWECQTLDFNPRQFRYELGSDGDSSM